MVISEFIRSASLMLTENARFEVELMVMKVLSITRTQLVVHGNTEISQKNQDIVLDMIHRRQNGEPLQYILGECEFMSLDFSVEPGVLIPRPDTEILVEEVLKHTKGKKNILDICTGSGCIGISLAHYNKDIHLSLLDISDTAISVSKRNAALNNVSDRVKIIKMDILKEYPICQYDIIVSNPPYIESAVIKTLQTEVKDFEPHLALDGGSDGLMFYRRITEIAPYILNTGGILAFEIGFNQGKAVSELMRNDFENILVTKDLCNNDRVVTGILKKKG